MLGRMQQCKMRAPDLMLVRVDVGHTGELAHASLGLPQGHQPFVDACNELSQWVQQEFSHAYVHEEMKLVYSGAKGLRARLLLAMDAAHVHSDRAIGEAVRDAWIHRFGGVAATAYNCNNTWYKSMQEPCGIGLFPLAEENFLGRINAMVVSFAKVDAMACMAYPGLGFTSFAANKL